MCFVFASFVPGALWAGALVPYATERNATQLFQIPSFDIANSSQIWNGNTKLASRVDGAGQNWVTDLGLFSFERASMRGPLQASASDASFVTDNFHRHAKLDKTGYAYINRSYGAGGIAGFVNFTDLNSTNWFTLRHRCTRAFSTSRLHHHHRKDHHHHQAYSSAPVDTSGPVDVLSRSAHPVKEPKAVTPPCPYHAVTAF